ncbi:MAG TPA: NADH-quinone oxidoreductase subunit H [Vicinamibacterales bacterium]|nr:NADH-quinone oxidoreductase subunit H [Vicinamibacterales bacterium]HOG29263.1 NADH-quinone oxidoreductase subunit H [Vicinamibacterales bacterium]HOQ60331.1 NADH-quinone oxidoreductase subunit H [Vicinamibacterales bacterium]HPK70884.1 NADH-quinone oxidoreductase subunit H [Vicinamibacterales bacterium]HPW21347.1 NADH-quinone oxidoreductase subunit H [Vicinamibacterales bacterium]
MSPALLTLVQGAIVVALAPLAPGLVRRFKAVLQGRQGPPTLLPYWTIATLFRKETVVSQSASWVFLAAPTAVLASSLLAACVLPLVSRGGALAPLSHLLAVSGIWMLGSVFLVLGGLDPGSAFGGMGASREMTISAFLEPALVVSLAALAIASGSPAVDAMMDVAGRGLLLRPWLLPAVGGLALVALGENARYPVDNPATHLELTMVHEAMLLEYSGPHLAILELASAVKLATFALLLANLLVPAGLLRAGAGPLAAAAAVPAAIAKLAVTMGGLALVESGMAKLRLYRLPEFFFGALFLGLTSLGIGLMAGFK